ncbi:MAG: hypothetical protein KDH88_13055 [Chromatiales bacterium]|nr:hypothetical protein [Chromatiales bacterium]
METKQLELTLYLAHQTAETDRLVDELKLNLEAKLPGQWRLEVVDVVAMPELALAHDVFATPTLVRTAPEPVVKVLGSLAKIKEASITITIDPQHPLTSIG